MDVLVLRAALMLAWIETFDSRASRLFRWNDLQRMIVEGYRPPEAVESEVRRALGERS